MVAQEETNVDRRRAKEQVLRPGEQGEPVDPIVVGGEHGLVDQASGRVQARADDLELANALVELRTPEPVANTGDGPAQSRIKSSQRRDRVFSGQVQRRPT